MTLALVALKTEGHGPQAQLGNTQASNTEFSILHDLFHFFNNVNDLGSSKQIPSRNMYRHSSRACEMRLIGANDRVRRGSKILTLRFHFRLQQYSRLPLDHVP